MGCSLTLKVMTFNVRFDNPEDGIHAWPLRKELVARTVLDEAPDLLGTQECTPGQLAYLLEHLEGYQACISRREPETDPKVQMPTIFYKRGLLAPSHFGEFWLSETPRVYRSRSWGAAFPRLFTYGKFRHMATRACLWFANTHLDHVSAEARRRAASMIRHWVVRRRLPVILVGDFNEGPEGKVHGVLTSGPRGLRDAWSALRPQEEPQVSTVHHFTGKGQGGRIDWILTSPQVEVLEMHLVERLEGLPSDHFPCVATLRLG